MRNDQTAKNAERATVAESSPLLHSTKEARRLLGGMGRTWLFEQIKAGRIRVAKLGTRTLIPDSELQRILAESMQEGAP